MLAGDWHVFRGCFVERCGKLAGGWHVSHWTNAQTTRNTKTYSQNTFTGLDLSHYILSWCNANGISQTQNLHLNRKIRRCKQ